MGLASVVTPRRVEHAPCVAAGRASSWASGAAQLPLWRQPPARSREMPSRARRGSAAGPCRAVRYGSRCSRRRPTTVHLPGAGSGSEGGTTRGEGRWQGDAGIARGPMLLWAHQLPSPTGGRDAQGRGSGGAGRAGSYRGGWRGSRGPGRSRRVSGRGHLRPGHPLADGPGHGDTSLMSAATTRPPTRERTSTTSRSLPSARDTAAHEEAPSAAHTSSSRHERLM